MSQGSNFKAPMEQPPKPSQAQASGASGKAIASLVLGLLSIVGMCFTGIPALILGIMGLGDINKSAGRIGGKGLAITGIVLGAIGTLWTVILLLIGMLLPAVQQVREAARRTTSMNNIRQQGLAMHNYHSAYQHLPAQNRDGLSWRVHILPFLEENELHSRFNLDEPWDSPNNIQLLPEMPQIFACNGVELPPGLTIYQVPYTDVQTGPAPEDLALFDNSGESVSFQNISDGSSNTIMILEVDAAAAVEWTKPSDWKYDPTNPIHDLGNVRPGIILVGFADGSTTVVPNGTSPEGFKALITRQAGDMAVTPY